MLLKSVHQRARRWIDLRLAFWICALILGCFQLTLVTLYETSASNPDISGELVYLLDAPPPRPAKRELKWKNVSQNRKNGADLSKPTNVEGSHATDLHSKNRKSVSDHHASVPTAETRPKSDAKPKKEKRHMGEKPNKLAIASFDIGDQLQAIQQAGKLYSIGRKDRSGSVITDQLFAHAFAFAHKVDYAGACFTVKGLPKKDTRTLLSQLQWDSYLKFGCPRGEAVFSDPEAESSPLVLNADVYRHNLNESYFTKAWRDEIQRLLPKEKMTSSKMFEIAVHVRRGDVSPCRYKRRYLPNKHYLELIERHLPKNRDTHVTIFSESDSFESFDDFRSRGFDVQLDTELAGVWKALASADVTILSRSYFSFVPAAVNPNTVVYTDFFEFEPLESWERADKDLVRRTDKQIREMYKTSCNATAIELERQLQDKKHDAQR